MGSHLPHYPLVPVANIVASVLILLSLVNSGTRHAWNSGVVMLGIWIFTTGILTAVDAIVWADNVDNVSPVWCDISTRIGLGSTVGVPACSLVITRRLCKIARARNFEVETPGKRQAELLLEVTIGFGLPALVIVLYYIVQGARFLTFEEVGCNAAVYACGLAILLMHSWGIVLPLISLIFYCPPIIWTFFRHNRQLNDFLRSNASGVSRSRYYRLLALGCIDIILTLPLGIIHLVLDIGQLEPRIFWPGWDVVHAQFDEVIPVTADEWRPDFWSRFGFGFDNWINPVFAVVFFAFFGLTSEAKKMYARVFWSLVGLVGWKRPARPELSRIGFGSAPVDTRGTDIGSRLSISFASPFRSDINGDASNSEKGEGGSMHSVDPSAFSFPSSNSELGKAEGQERFGSVFAGEGSVIPNSTPWLDKDGSSDSDTVAFAY